MISTSPLEITNSVALAIRKLTIAARENPITEGHFMAILNGRLPPPGHDPSRCILVPSVYRCVFTIEQHWRDIWYQHLTVNIDTVENTVSVSPKNLSILMGMFEMPDDEEIREHERTHVREAIGKLVSVLRRIEPESLLGQKLIEKNFIGIK